MYVKLLDMTGSSYFVYNTDTEPVIGAIGLRVLQSACIHIANSNLLHAKKSGFSRRDPQEILVLNITHMREEYIQTLSPEPSLLAHS